MPHAIGFVTAGAAPAHKLMLQAIRVFAASCGWTVLRSVEAGADWELILRAPGLSGTEQIFVGFRTYDSVGADFYNLAAGVFTGYVSGNAWDAQPGAMVSGVPAHNNRIDYWLTANGQRMVLAMKVGAPAYEYAYVGKMLPYATPGQYPYPVVCGGMLSGMAATRYSDTAHSMPFKGAAMSGNARPGMRLRNAAGAWVQPWCWPWGRGTVAGVSGSALDLAARDVEGVYELNPIVLHDNGGLTGDTVSALPGNVWGELDGVFHVSGFNNAAENTLVIGGVTYVVLQDVSRNGFTDYVAVRMDA